MRGTWQGSGTWQTTSGGGGGGGLAVVVVIVVAAVLGGGAASAIASALEVILIVIGSLIGLAVLGGIAWLVHRTRQDRPRRPIAAPVVYRLPPAEAPRLEAAQPLALEPPREIHLHLHGLTPDQITAIVTQRGAYLEED